MGLILGVDVGKTGALAFLEGARLTIHAMPTLDSGPGGKAEIDEDGLSQLIVSYSDWITHAFVERVNAMPSQPDGAGNRRKGGASSMFSFGRSYQAVRSTLACHKVPRTYVTPVTWKRALQVPKDDPGIEARAAELLPKHVALWHGPKRGFWNGHAEAAMIAEYGRRQLAAI